MMAYLWVAIGGALGSVARFALNGVISDRFGQSFPLGTLVINIAGSFIIGILGALTIPEGRMSSEARVFATQFIMVGICGGFTTFSSFSMQTLSLIQEREWLYAFGNIILSVALCMIAVWLGYLLGSIIGPVKGH